MKDSFWRCFIQPERRLHIRSTISEMLAISAILYGGMAVLGLASLTLPDWTGIDFEVIFGTCIISLALAIEFYLARESAPLWVVVTHVPVGIAMVGVVVHAVHTPQAANLTAVYILGAMYTFHYFTRWASAVIILYAMAGFALAMYTNDVADWQQVTVFLTGCCFITGIVAHITVKQLNHLAMHDNLTGLYDRRTIDALVSECIASKNEKGTAKVAMLMLDLNGFKQINDSKGHLRGDEVLKAVSAAIRENIGKQDCAARWGGDEFLIVSPTDNENYMISVERGIRESLKNIIGFEAGTAIYRAGDTLDDMTRRADEGMYRKKRNRRATDVAVA